MMGERLIVAGGRDITDYTAVEQAISSSGFEVDEIVSGKARGVDTLGEIWAEASGVPVKPFPAKWKYLGKAAGHVRNEAMAKYGTALVAVWDGVSTGTFDMLRRACQERLPIFVHIFPMPLRDRTPPVSLLRAAMMHHLPATWWTCSGWESLSVAIFLEAVRLSLRLPDEFSLDDIMSSCADATEALIMELL